MTPAKPVTSLAEISPDFNLFPFARLLQPIINEVLRKAGKDQARKGTKLVGSFLVWVVIMLTIRRDLGYPALVNWLVSALRWQSLSLAHKLLSDGALSKARVALGWEIFQTLFERLVAAQELPPPDFHQFRTALFDGTTLTMPDTPANTVEFGKPGNQRGKAAFPQLRLLSLIWLGSRTIIAVAFGRCVGAGSGERSLLTVIVARVVLPSVLYLLDAGLYSFALVWQWQQSGAHFITKPNWQTKLTPVKTKRRYRDGSYLSELTGKVPDPLRSTAKKPAYRTETMFVRVIVYHLKGFRPSRLITNILDPQITAQEIVQHYHRRWEIELAYAEIKTVQCATLRGQLPTHLRSKRPDLIKQEVYALLLGYNLIRVVMQEAAQTSEQAVHDLSFLDSLQVILDSLPLVSARSRRQQARAYQYLLQVVAQATIDRPRRARVAPRVVKTQRSPYRRKRAGDVSQARDFAKEVKIIRVSLAGEQRVAVAASKEMPLAA